MQMPHRKEGGMDYDGGGAAPGGWPMQMGMGVGHGPGAAGGYMGNNNVSVQQSVHDSYHDASAHANNVSHESRASHASEAYGNSPPKGVGGGTCSKTFKC